MAKRGLDLEAMKDSEAGAVYIRFRNTKVQKTIADESRGTVVTFDLDREGQLIGVELVGVKEFSLREFRRAVPELKRVDLEGALLAPTPG